MHHDHEAPSGSADRDASGAHLNCPADRSHRRTVTSLVLMCCAPLLGLLNVPLYLAAIAAASDSFIDDAETLGDGPENTSASDYLLGLRLGHRATSVALTIGGFFVLSAVLALVLGWFLLRERKQRFQGAEAQSWPQTCAWIFLVLQLAGSVAAFVYHPLSSELLPDTDHWGIGSSVPYWYTPLRAPLLGLVCLAVLGAAWSLYRGRQREEPVEGRQELDEHGPPARARHAALTLIALPLLGLLGSVVHLLVLQARFGDGLAQRGKTPMDTAWTHVRVTFGPSVLMDLSSLLFHVMLGTVAVALGWALLRGWAGVRGSTVILLVGQLPLIALDFVYSPTNNAIVFSKANGFSPMLLGRPSFWLDTVSPSGSAGYVLALRIALVLAELACVVLIARGLTGPATRQHVLRRAAIRYAQARREAGQLT